MWSRGPGMVPYIHDGILKVIESDHSGSYRVSMVP